MKFSRWGAAILIFAVFVFAFCSCHEEGQEIVAKIY